MTGLVWTVQGNEIVCKPIIPNVQMESTRKFRLDAETLANLLGKKVVDCKRFPRAKAFFARLGTIT